MVGPEKTSDAFRWLYYFPEIVQERQHSRGPFDEAEKSHSEARIQIRGSIQKSQINAGNCSMVQSNWKICNSCSISWTKEKKNGLNANQAWCCEQITQFKNESFKRGPRQSSKT